MNFFLDNKNMESNKVDNTYFGEEDEGGSATSLDLTGFEEEDEGGSATSQLSGPSSFSCSSYSSSSVPVPKMASRPKKKSKTEDIKQKEKRDIWTVDMPRVLTTQVQVVPAKLRSQIWVHFQKMSKCSVALYNLADYAVCKICYEEAEKSPDVRFLIKSQGSTTKLTRHLNSNHPEILLAEEEDKAIILLSDESSQKTMMSFLCDGTMNVNTYRYLKWVCLNSRPLSICEDKQFIEMQIGLSKDYKPLDRHYVTEKLRSIYLVVKQILIRMLKDQDVAITTDHWSSVTNSTFTAVTAHYINDDWDMVSLTLQCRESEGESTADDCEEDLKRSLREYNLNLESTVALVTDSEATMSLLGRNIPTEQRNFSVT